jgi:hypothetical protein
VPWCETCERFYNPNTLEADGTCPSCGRPVAQPAPDGPVPPPPTDTVEGPGAPWHFKVLIAVTAVYLGYRLFQGIFWVAHHL